MAATIHVFTLVVAVLFNPVSDVWNLDDDRNLVEIVPGWYLPAMTGVLLVTISGLIVWLIRASSDPTYLRRDAPR